MAGFSCEFGCMNGQLPIGQKKIYCNAMAQWSGRPPICSSSSLGGGMVSGQIPGQSMNPGPEPISGRGTGMEAGMGGSFQPGLGSGMGRGTVRQPGMGSNDGRDFGSGTGMGNMNENGVASSNGIGNPGAISSTGSRPMSEGGYGQATAG